MQAEITTGHGTGVQAKLSLVSQDFKVQVTSALYKQVIFDPCPNGLFKSSQEIPVRARRSWTKNERCSQRLGSDKHQPPPSLQELCDLHSRLESGFSILCQLLRRVVLLEARFPCTP